MTRIENLAAGTYQITLWRIDSHFKPVRESIGPGEVRRLDFTLPLPIEVTGVIRHNGGPIDGGSLRFTPWRMGGLDSIEVEVDSDGRKYRGDPADAHATLTGIGGAATPPLYRLIRFGRDRYAYRIIPPGQYSLRLEIPGGPTFEERFELEPEGKMLLQFPPE